MLHKHTYTKHFSNGCDTTTLELLSLYRMIFIYLNKCLVWIKILHVQYNVWTNNEHEASFNRNCSSHFSLRQIIVSFAHRHYTVTLFSFHRKYYFLFLFSCCWCCCFLCYSLSDVMFIREHFNLDFVFWCFDFRWHSRCQMNELEFSSEATLFLYMFYNEESFFFKFLIRNKF